MPLCAITQNPLIFRALTGAKTLGIFGMEQIFIKRPNGYKGRTMLKNVLLAIFVFASLALAGCATNIGAHDASVPPEKLCTLTIDIDLSVHTFDGETVDWRHRIFTTSVVVQIPAGKHNFVMDYISGGRSMTRYAYNIAYSHTFEAGKSYVMEPKVANGRVSAEVKEE